MNFNIAKKKLLFLLALAVTISLIAVGCSGQTKVTSGVKNEQTTSTVSQNQQDGLDTSTGEKNPASSNKVKLYFSDDQALYLIPEEREITFSGGKEELLKKVLEELIKGPREKNLYLTIPKEVEVNSVKLADGLATVDFSEELKTKHWGGSTGESFTIYSIVDTLTEFPEVKKVQILVAGKKIDSLAGHLDISEPLIRDNTLIRK